MALQLGKLSIIIGAGLVGSVFAKEGVLPDVSNLVSGALKMVFRQLKEEEPSKLISNPRNDALSAQVRHELQLLTSNSPITIVTIEGSGARKYGLIIIIGVIDYGYVRWKGWKLPDFMFATRRSLSDACNNVGNQIDGFTHRSRQDTKQELSSKIDRIDRSLDANTEIIQKQDERYIRLNVIELGDGTVIVKDDVKSVFDAVETLASKVYRIEENQDITLRGVGALHAKENIRVQESKQALPSTPSVPALEAAPTTLSSRTLSLPPASPRESQSPSTSNGAQQSRGSLQHAQSISGLKDISESSSSCETMSNGTHSRGNGGSGSSSGMFGRFSIPRIVRTHSVVNRVPTN